jgi:hypothetical protein
VVPSVVVVAVFLSMSVSVSIVALGGLGFILWAQEGFIRQVF